MEIGEYFMIWLLVWSTNFPPPQKSLIFSGRSSCGRDGVGVGVRVRVRSSIKSSVLGFFEITLEPHAHQIAVFLYYYPRYYVIHSCGKGVSRTHYKRSTAQISKLVKNRKKLLKRSQQVDAIFAAQIWFHKIPNPGSQRHEHRPLWTLFLQGCG